MGTPNGPRVRVTSIITEAEIDPSPLYEGPKICDPHSCGFICVKACPLSALSERESVSVEIGGKAFCYGKLDKWVCRWGAAGFTSASLGRKEMPKPDLITPENYLVTRKQEDPWQAMEMASVGRGSFCGKCMIECPVGWRD